jgi:hypothetical protein
LLRRIAEGPKARAFVADEVEHEYPRGSSR